MRKGAVPIPYLIAIILGVVVIALLGYWFFVTGGSLSASITKGECDNKLMIYCIEWSSNNYVEVPDFGDWSTYASGCQTHHPNDLTLKTKCQTLLGQPTTP